VVLTLRQSADAINVTIGAKFDLRASLSTLV
jgi:hypothetical protein